MARFRLDRPVDWRARWGDGPWAEEPDRWDGIAAGFAVHVGRDIELGYLCGYLDVPPGHPWHGIEHEEIDADVHGGLTYAEPTSNRAWRVGFDCAHQGDLIPLTTLPQKAGEYRSLPFVKRELSALAQQAAQAAGPGLPRCG